MSQFSSLVDLLHQRAADLSERVAYTYLVDGENHEAHLTYGALDERARAVASLLSGHVSPGDRALLIYPPGLDFITAFFGCLYAGVIAVPAAPAKRNHLSRLSSIATDSGATVALTTDSLLTELKDQLATRAHNELLWFATEAVQSDRAAEWRPPALGPDSLAFLQYTSGSTGTPKGVMVSHGNLLHNQAMLREAFGHSEHTNIVGWLPLFHDMGLIGTVLQPLYLGTRAVLMSPAAFLQRPSRWLQAITKYHATTSGGPNFAYDLCVRKITPEERDALDLSTWQVAFSGAEPVRAQTLEQFTAAFEPCGFQRNALYPCYGLAEATLFVTGGDRYAPPATLTVVRSSLEANHVTTSRSESGSATIVGTGRPWNSQDVAIVDPGTREPCSPQQVGELWVTGPSVAQGYWNRAELTLETFQARLEGNDGRAFLRTGDLGFMRHGELYVTGRIDDVIIIRGRNHYPQDIEATAEASHPALRLAAGAAFSAEVDGETQLVVAQEVERTQLRKLSDPAEATRAIHAIRRAVSAEHGLQVHTVLLLKPGSIPKTTSGKIRRGECRTRYLEGQFHDLALAPATHPAEQAGSVRRNEPGPGSARTRQPQEHEIQLRARVAGILGVPSEQVQEDQELSTLGLDSLQIIELKHHIETHHGVEITVEEFFGGLTLHELKRVIEAGTPITHEASASLRHRTAQGTHVTSKSTPTKASPNSDELKFSLLYFSSDATGGQADPYRLLVDGAKFADRNGFHAVWVPERHFHPFGGLYPNPSVLAGALAMVTRQLRLRAGSVVLPLHDPVRVAEEWSVIDNLSHGRVDLAFAVGWNPQDFALAPDRYTSRVTTFQSRVDEVRRLWRGETVTRTDGHGEQRQIRIYPPPAQPELPVWFTCTGGPERFIEAGAAGANVLTAMLFQTEEQLAENIGRYRKARAEHGLDPDAGQVTLMLHTFLGADHDEVREQVRKPFTDYLRSSVMLWRQESRQLSDLSERQQEEVLAAAFERYFRTAGLFGTPEGALGKVARLRRAGVNEIACLIDFGVDADTVLAALHPLNELRELARHPTGAAPQDNTARPRDLNPAQAEQLLADLGDLTDDEVDALLHELSRDGG